MKSGNIFQASKPKKKPRFKVQDTIGEHIRSIGSDVAKSVKKDLIKGSAQSAAKSIFNPSSLRPREGLQRPEFPFSREQFQKPQKIERPRETFLYTAKEAEMQRKIEDIRHELKEMIEQLQNVSREISKSVNAPIAQAGVYYINYLDRLKAVLTVLRKELSESSTWGALTQSRKKHRGFWSQYKKQGTQFGLSSEHKMTRSAG